MRLPRVNLIALTTIYLSFQLISTDRQDFINNELQNHFNHYLKAEGYRKVDKIYVPHRQMNHNHNYNRQEIDSYIIVYEKEGDDSDIEDREPDMADDGDEPEESKPEIIRDPVPEDEENQKPDRNEEPEDIESNTGNQPPDAESKDEKPPNNNEEKEPKSFEEPDKPLRLLKEEPNQEKDDGEGDDEDFEGLCFEPFRFDGLVKVADLNENKHTYSEPIFENQNTVVIQKQSLTVIKMQKDLYQLSIQSLHSNCFLMMVFLTDYPLDVNLSVNQKHNLFFIENMNRSQFFDHMYKNGLSFGREWTTMDFNYDFDPEKPKYLNFLCPFWEDKKEPEARFKLNAKYLSSSGYYFGNEYFYFLSFEFYWRSQKR